jgi:hypothetical protein
MITSNSAIANKGYLQYQPQSELLQFVHHRFVPEKEVVTSSNNADAEPFHGW